MQTQTNENLGTEKLSIALNKIKTELVSKKKNLLIEKIKTIVIDYVYYSEKQLKTNFSDYLSEKLNYHYNYMANLFSKVHGSSIQSFIIATKVERAKELLLYEDYSLTIIAYKLHYSSVAHLSNQFKKVTGISPSQFAMSVSKNADLLPAKFQKTVNAHSQESETLILPLTTAHTENNFEESLRQVGG